MSEHIPFHWLDSIQSRHLVKARLVARTGLRVGVGRDLGVSATSDLPIIRDAEGAPFIPGSSLKGCLRSWTESLLRGVGRSRRLACNPLDKSEQCCGDSKQLKGADLYTYIQAEICACCATYGGQRLGSHLRFLDARPAPGQPLHSQVRDGVALDRDLGRVRGSLKYDFEVVQPGASFELQVEGRNLQDWQLGLLLAALSELSEGGIRVGGFGSRGLGAVTLEGLVVERRDLPDLLAGRPGRRLEAPELDQARGALLAFVDGFALGGE